MKGRTSANSIFRVLHEHSTRQETASRRGWGVTPPSLRHDIPMAESFLAALDPDADRFTFQLFSDGDADYARIIHGTIHELWPTVEKLNVPERQVGVFVTVNATDFKGRCRDNIIRARALFVDADGEQQVGKCIDAIKASRATPSLIVRTSANAAHFYWLCDDLAPETFEFYQPALLSSLGTDPAVKDLSRVMRLPGTLHLKQAANPRLVRLIGKGQPRRWKIDELVAKLSLPLFDGRRVRDNVVYPDFERSGPKESTTGEDPEIDRIRSAVDAIPSSILASENDWVRIARGLAHQASISGPDAENLWAILDEASRQAPNYDASENRRRWERYVKEASQRQRPITIATVFAQARSAGWQPATGETPDTEVSVPYVPGNEEVCRRALDQVVAADERVFTLEGSSLLSILRTQRLKIPEPNGRVTCLARRSPRPPTLWSGRNASPGRDLGRVGFLFAFIPLKPLLAIGCSRCVAATLRENYAESLGSLASMMMVKSISLLATIPSLAFIRTRRRISRFRLRHPVLTLKKQAKPCCSRSPNTSSKTRSRQRPWSLEWSLPQLSDPTCPQRRC
jgi:Primase C terminal 2 (PriCT-2)/RepB DNA-primase N-terminal domain